MTESEISEVNSIKSGLRKYGIDLHDAKNLREYLCNMEETEFKPQKFVAFAKKHGSARKSFAHFERLCMLAKAKSKELSDSTQKLKAHKQRLETDVTSLNFQRNYLKAEVDSCTIQLNQVMDATENAEIIRQKTIDQTAKMRGMDNLETDDLRINKQSELIQATLKEKAIRKLYAFLAS